MAYPPTEIISAAILRDVLEHPLDYPWRSHGIGMLRTYLDSEKHWRLNLWHSRLLNPGISTMHTHPWSFESFVIAGELKNTRFSRRLSGRDRAMFGLYPTEFWEGIIPCGDHAPKQHDDGPLIEGDPQRVWLAEQRTERYFHASQYQQAPEEIHDTGALNGTITVMHRTGYTEEGRASVFWPVGEPWGDASRATTEEDILVTCAAALAELNKTPWSVA